MSRTFVGGLRRPVDFDIEIAKIIFMRDCADTRNTVAIDVSRRSSSKGEGMLGLRTVRP